MKILKTIIAPFRDKYKLQRKLNTIELQKKELEIVLNSRVTETLMRTLENQDEVERLTKENQRLRSKLKEIRNGGK